MITTEPEQILRKNEQKLRRCTSIEKVVKSVPDVITDPLQAVDDGRLERMSDDVYKFLKLQNSVYLIKNFKFNKFELIDEILNEMIDSPPNSNSLPFSSPKSSPLRDDSLRFNRLRWSCVGYHYDWGERSYNTKNFSNFPNSLKLIYFEILKLINYPTPPDPQSAIINFYHSHRPSDRLGGHRDDVELDDESPLVSLSMGLPGVFLCESESMVLEDSDVVVMSGKARQSLHGVPTIIHGSGGGGRLLDRVRVSISIRSVF
jgi:DNA alkylation damage repair protein AlkB